MNKNIPIEIKDHLDKGRAKTGQKHGSNKNPVNNYNKDNKQNKNNKNNCDESLSMSAASPKRKVKSEHVMASEDTEALTEKGLVSQTALDREEASCSAAKRWLSEEQIDQAVIQLFFNAEGRNKHNLKLQIKMQGEYMEFICTLTTDLHNFKKFGGHIAQEHQHEIINQALDVRNKLKAIQVSQKKNVYMGKFRESSGNAYLEGEQYMMPIEARTLGIVWYDNIEHKWNVAIQFHNLQIESSMTSEGLTDKQKTVGIKCQHVHYPEIKFKRKSWTDRWQAGEL